MPDPAAAPLATRLAILVVALLVVAAPSGCAHREPAEPRPADVLRDYLAALERDDADAAWALLDPTLRGDRTRETFREWVHRNREELIEQARAALAAATDQPVEMRAVVRVGDEDVTVVREADGWRLAAPYWPEPPAQSPAAALQALHDALSRGDLATARDALLTADARASLDALVATLAAAAETAPESPSDDDVEITVPLDGGGAAVLVRDGDRWRVASLRLGPEAP